MFNLFNKKKKVSSKEMAGGLWMFCKKFSKGFQDDLISTLKETGIKLDEEQEIDIVFEIIKMNLWIISKALSADKDVLNELHKIYIYGHENLAKTEEEKVAFPKQAEHDLNEVYAKYYNAWDDNSGGNQSILSLTILEQLLNKGNPNKQLLDARLTFFVNTHVLTMLKAVLDFRNGFEIR